MANRPSTQERFKRIDRTFAEVLELPPAARAARLAEVCGEDETLRCEVEALLESARELDGDADFLGGPLDEGKISGMIDLACRGSAGPGELRSDRVIAGYRLCEVLGRGGGGVVYRALRACGSCAGIPAEVALKIGWVTVSKKEAGRFRREQEILQRLAHPGIASFYEFGRDADGQSFLVMELVRGEPIDRYCDSRRLPIGGRLELFSQLCAAVQYLHDLGVVHRDLKPGNVLVTAAGRVKLLDFGIAKALDSSTFQTRLDPTDSQVHLVTPGYCSPEQVKDKRVTPASDVYSLAVLLFELLTSSKPYRFESSSPQLLDILQAVYERPPQTLREALELAAQNPKRAEELCRKRGVHHLAALRRQLPRGLERLLDQALARSPARRPQNAGALAAAIHRCVQGNFFSRLGATLRARIPH